MEDFIESVFDTCDEEGFEEGLTLTEVKERHCLDYLTITIGMLDDNVERVFEAIDENGDGFISKQESFNEEELQPDWEIAESGEPRINKMILFE